MYAKYFDFSHSSQNWPKLIYIFRGKDPLYAFLRRLILASDVSKVIDNSLIYERDALYLPNNEKTDGHPPSTAQLLMRPATGMVKTLPS